MDIYPKLVDPNFKYLVRTSLKSCRQFKNKHINKFFNIGMLIFLITVVSIMLYVKYKGKLTPKQLEEKKTKDKLYIFSKLKQLDMIKKRENNELLTNLPIIDSPEMHNIR